MLYTLPDMKRLMIAALAFALSFCSAELYATENPIIHFAFTSSADDSGQYTGTPAGGAALRALGDRLSSGSTRAAKIRL